MKICIVGIGKLGYLISETLCDGGNDVIIIDNDEQRIQNVGNSLDAYTVALDALVKTNLEEIGVGSCDLLVAVTENDEKNIIICSMAKKLGCAKTMARVREPEHLAQREFLKEVFEIDQLLNPDYECAVEISKFLTEKYSIEGGLFTQNQISILEFDIKNLQSLIGKKVMESSELMSGLLVGAISRNGKIIVPNGSNIFEEDDIIYAVGKEKDILKFASKVRSKETNELPKRVMIAGGGKTGFFLAKLLEEKGIAVKIIEKDLDRCKKLASLLDDTVIINGDASVENLLKEEGIDSMDAFVAATGFDEGNLLLSLLVQNIGLDHVAAKVSRQTFTPIIKQLGTAAIINPQEIIANNLLSFVRKNGIVLFSKKINGQAEFKEIQAQTDMPITKKSLSELDIPEGVLILAVNRGNDIIIPNGKTQINAGDKVILLSLLSSVGEFESLLSNTQTSIL